MPDTSASCSGPPKAWLPPRSESDTVHDRLIAKIHADRLRLGGARTCRTAPDNREAPSRTGPVDVPLIAASRLVVCALLRAASFRHGPSGRSDRICRDSVAAYTAGATHSRRSEEVAATDVAAASTVRLGSEPATGDELDRVFSGVFANAEHSLSCCRLLAICAPLENNSPELLRGCPFHNAVVEQRILVIGVRTHLQSDRPGPVNGLRVRGRATERSWPRVRCARQAWWNTSYVG
jgi:hypothetical protein